MQRHKLKKIYINCFIVTSFLGFFTITVQAQNKLIINLNEYTPTSDLEEYWIEPVVNFLNEDVEYESTKTSRGFVFDYKKEKNRSNYEIEIGYKLLKNQERPYNLFIISTPPFYNKNIEFNLEPFQLEREIADEGIDAGIIRKTSKIRLVNAPIKSLVNYYRQARSYWFYRKSTLNGLRANYDIDVMAASFYLDSVVQLVNRLHIIEPIEFERAKRFLLRLQEADDGQLERFEMVHKVAAIILSIDQIESYKLNDLWVGLKKDDDCTTRLEYLREYKDRFVSLSATLQKHTFELTRVSLGNVESSIAQCIEANARPLYSNLRNLNAGVKQQLVATLEAQMIALEIAKDDRNTDIGQRKSLNSDLATFRKNIDYILSLK